MVLATKQEILEQEDAKVTESTASSPTLGTLRMTPLAHEKPDGTLVSPRPIRKPGEPQSSDTALRKDVASPTFTSMKEVFDVSYAVHRMAEEKARRKALAANPKAQTAAFTNIHAMNDMDEDVDDGNDDDEYGLTTDNSDSSQSADSSEESEAPAPESQDLTNVKVQLDNLKLKDPPSQRLQQAQRERLAANLKGSAKTSVEKPKSMNKPSKKSPFELKIGSATLLERRKQRQQLPDPPAVQG